MQYTLTKTKIKALKILYSLLLLFLSVLFLSDINKRRMVYESKAWKIALHINFSCFLFGYSLGVFSSVSDAISVSYNWNKDSIYIELFSSLLPIGALPGSLITELILGKYGRKSGTIIANMIYIVGSLVILFNSTWAIGISRFIVGISAGMCLALAPIYINEVVPPEMMKNIGPTMSLYSAGGLIVAYFFGLLIELVGDSQALWMSVLLFPILIAAYQSYYLHAILEYDSPY